MSLPAETAVLASDADRDAVARVLNEAFAAGRLTADEHRGRVDLAYAARTWPELAKVTADLPRPAGPAEVQAEPQGMHRVFSVVAVDCHQSGPVGVCAGLAGHGGLLCPQVTEEPGRCQPGYESVGVADQFGSGFVAEDDLVVWHEQHEQDRGVPGQGQPGPFARGVDDDIQVASP